jgi:hypothetical protein
MKHCGFKQGTDRTIAQSLRRIALRICACLIVLSPTVTLQICAAAVEPPKTFSSPEDAAHAMVDALRKDDRATLITIFGSGSRGLLTSGDPVADKNFVQNFLRDYDQMHRFSRGPDGRLFLVVGAENWPMPIPLLKNTAGWYFDTPYGKQELLFRRIGENEHNTIATLNAIVAGQREYFDQNHGKGATGEYAQKILSDQGTTDGLYWNTAAGEPESPIGPLVARASEEGYRASSQGKPIPVYGYYFKILTRQGKHAPGGGKDYVVDGQMRNGFAVLAYPAIYRSSGVMTFLVDTDANVLQKDLGPGTDELAKAIDSYDPDRSWQPAQ